MDGTGTLTLRVSGGGLMRACFGVSICSGELANEPLPTAGGVVALGEVVTAGGLPRADKRSALASVEGCSSSCDSSMLTLAGETMGNKTSSYETLQMNSRTAAHTVSSVTLLMSDGSGLSHSHLCDLSWSRKQRFWMIDPPLFDIFHACRAADGP